MPDNLGDPRPDAERPPKPATGPRKNLETPPAVPDWRSMWWYIPLMLLILWFWQDQLRQMACGCSSPGGCEPPDSR